MLTRDTAKYLRRPELAQRSVAYTTVHSARPLADGVSYCAQSLTPYRSLLPASSTFDLFFKVLFHLSFTLLLRYRSGSYI